MSNFSEKALFSEKASLLLAKYAIGCLTDRREDPKLITGEDLDSKKKKLEEMIRNGDCDEALIKDLFPIPYNIIPKTAKDPKRITEEDIRKYFLNDHNNFVKEMGKEECAVRLATVVKCYGQECDVEHDNKIERVKCFDELKKGDPVLVHLGYAVEKYDENLHTW